MANTYSQMYFHIVFAVRNRRALIHDSFKNKLYAYISGIVTNQGQKLLIMNGMPDHVHLLVNCKTTFRIDELVKEIKEHSTRFINSNNYVKEKFYWQGGYGVFTVSHGHLDRVFNYIRRQEEHHAKKNLRMEYTELLKEEGIEYDVKYIFDDPADIE